MARFVRLAVGWGRSERGVVGQAMELKQVVQELADLIWVQEQRLQRPVEATVLRFVQGAVAVELEYRRNMRDLNVLLTELESPEESESQATSAAAMVRRGLIDEGAAERQPDGETGEAVSPAS